MLLEGKIAIVTGAASGIGNGIAELFSEEGAKVALCDINDEGVKTAAAQISEKTGRKTLPITVDITNKKEVDKAVSQVVKEFGTVDILVNTAGILRLAHAVDLSEKDWDDTFAVNVKGALFFCQEAGKVMMKQKSGKIVNIASDSGKRPFPEEVAYCASKSAMIGMTRVFALELGPYNINSNAIAPGATDTPLLRKYYMKTEKDRQTYIDATALKRIAMPRDIAKVALFLASTLSDHVTGEIILTSAGDAFGE
jgi:NAD(P)-dependent dehydrogenase (short-subunit alcohol dehydrogenase family)